MPSLTFTPTSAVVSGSVTAPNSSWTNLSYLYDLSGSHTQTSIALAPNAETNYLIITGFGTGIPAGTTLTGVKFSFDVSLDSVSDSENVVATELYLQVNGANYGPNLAVTEGYLSDFGYGDGAVGGGVGDYIVDGLNLTAVESSTFGIKLKVKNTNQIEYYRAFINSVSLELFHSVEHPKFLYEGDSTSEVHIQLPLSDTTSTTVFQILHGIEDTTSPGTNYNYFWGFGFTAPNPNDPAVGYTPITQIPGHGSYDTNYLVPTYGTSLDSTNYCCYNITDHTMAYDTSGLVVGETYRRGLDLINIRLPILTIYGRLYDTLYFNIEIIPEADQLPHFIYNGDSTSEVTVTLDKKIGALNPTTDFLIHHGPDPDIITRNPDLILSYKTYSMYTDVDSTTADPVYDFDTSSIGTGIGVYPNNFLDTPQVDIVRGVSSLWGSSTDTTHTMSYNVSSLVAGNTYRRGHVLWYEAKDSSGVVYDSGVYDVLYFNVNVVDTTIPQLIEPYISYNGFTNLDANIVIDLNPTATIPTTKFEVYHGDIVEPSDGDDLIYYQIGGFYTSPLGNDTTSVYTPSDYTGAYSIGTYDVNYLDLTGVTWDQTSSVYQSHTTTSHIMGYDISGFVAGQTYRRGVALTYYDTDTSGDTSSGALRKSIYDVLYFNLDVIDTSPAPLTYPSYIYSADPYPEGEPVDPDGPDGPLLEPEYIGDTTSEINISMYPYDSTTITFGIKHDIASLPPGTHDMVDIFSYIYDIGKDATSDAIISPSWTSLDPSREVESGIYNNRPKDNYFGSGDLELIQLTISPFALGGVLLEPGTYRLYLSMTLMGYAYSVDPEDLVPDETNSFYEMDRLYINLTILPKIFRHTGTYSNSLV